MTLVHFRKLFSTWKSKSQWMLAPRHLQSSTD